MGWKRWTRFAPMAIFTEFDNRISETGTYDIVVEPQAIRYCASRPGAKAFRPCWSDRHRTTYLHSGNAACYRRALYRLVHSHPTQSLPKAVIDCAAYGSAVPAEPALHRTGAQVRALHARAALQ